MGLRVNPTLGTLGKSANAQGSSCPPSSPSSLAPSHLPHHWSQMSYLKCKSSHYLASITVFQDLWHTTQAPKPDRWFPWCRPQLQCTTLPLDSQLEVSIYKLLSSHYPSIPPKMLNTSSILNVPYIVVLPGPSRMSHFLQHTLPLWLQNGKGRFSVCSHRSQGMPPLCHTWEGASMCPFPQY